MKPLHKIIPIWGWLIIIAISTLSCNTPGSTDTDTDTQDTVTVDDPVDPTWSHPVGSFTNVDFPDFATTWTDDGPERITLYFHDRGRQVYEQIRTMVRDREDADRITRDWLIVHAVDRYGHYSDDGIDYYARVWMADAQPDKYHYRLYKKGSAYRSGIEVFEVPPLDAEVAAQKILAKYK